MKIKALLIPSLLLVVCPLASAELGQSPKQIEESYGKPLQTQAGKDADTISRIYQYRAFGVVVTFVKDVAREEIFYRADETDMSSDEIMMLLKQNSDGGQWTVVPARPPNKAFICEEKARRALYIAENKSLIIADDEYLRATGRLKAPPK